MRMTVANGSIYADHYANENRDDLCEYMDQGIQEFKYCLVPHTGGIILKLLSYIGLMEEGYAVGPEKALY